MGISDWHRHGGECMTFGERLYELRNKNNLSQEELAEVLDVSRQSISKWENDKGYPEMTRLLMKTNGNDFKNWMNHGTQIQILVRRIMIIGLIALMIYGTGYAIGTFIAHLGF